MPIVTHQVKKGETLWGLAQKYLGAGARWKEIKGYTGEPRFLPVGTTLTIPTVEKKEPDLEASEVYKDNLIKEKEIIPEISKIPEIPEVLEVPIEIPEVERLKRPKRIEELEETAFLPPVESPEMEKTRQEFEKAKEDYETAVGDINENPWLSEAGRVGRIKQVYEMYEMKAKRLESRYKTLKEVRTEERQAKIGELEYLTKTYPERKELWPEGVPTTYKDFILAGKPGVEELGEEGAYKQWLEKEKKPVKMTIEEITTNISGFLEDRKGRDEMVSAKTYQEARTRYIALGGRREDFKAQFPIEMYLAGQQLSKLPIDLRPKEKYPRKEKEIKLPIVSGLIEKATIEALAQAYSRGESLGTISAKMKSQVFIRAKEIALEDLRDDISQAKVRGDYGTRDKLINRLQGSYREFKKDEITQEVYDIIQEEPKSWKEGIGVPQPAIIQKSFFQRLFGKLF